ncbi:hypothetical protein CFOL_v3_18644 [Cephalotus follicularis]|uniref:Uncharacterized protein n=1 Tax=Cephalotus follicularis TaxID=3775 RepID=A0A1Q3C4K0_CEPFO|nr:hypothetical protein CFOL_v3_18644 [Cephalotus follicularis]
MLQDSGLVWRNLVCFALIFSKAHQLSNHCGIPLTVNLGKYFGANLFHSRVSKDSFKPLINRMQQKLAGWKAKVLNLACKTTLVQSVLSLCPTHTMQTNLLLVSICYAI